MAHDINAKYGRLADDMRVILRAAVEPWPYSAEAHAKALESPDAVVN